MLDDRGLVVEGSGQPASPVSAATEALVFSRGLPAMLTLGPGRMVVFSLSKPFRLLKKGLLRICKKPGEHCSPGNVVAKSGKPVPWTKILVTAPVFSAKFQAFWKDERPGRPRSLGTGGGVELLAKQLAHSKIEMLCACCRRWKKFGG